MKFGKYNLDEQALWKDLFEIPTRNKLFYLFLEGKIIGTSKVRYELSNLMGIEHLAIFENDTFLTVLRVIYAN